MVKTQTDRVINALVTKGQALTAKQISARFGAANPHGLVYSLRKKGLNIKLVTTKDSRGRETSKYTYVG
jgi:hypothetical protein